MTGTVAHKKQNNIKDRRRLLGADDLLAAGVAPFAAAQFAAFPDALTPPSLPPEGLSLLPHISQRTAVRHENTESRLDYS